MDKKARKKEGECFLRLKKEERKKISIRIGMVKNILNFVLMTGNFPLGEFTKRLYGLRNNVKENISAC